MKGCVVFHPKDLAVHLTPIWMSLSRESLNGQDPEVKTTAREALTTLLHNLAELPADVVGELTPMRQLLGDVISASVSALSQVQTALFMPSLELLLAAAKSCSEASEHILKTVSLDELEIGTLIYLFGISNYIVDLLQYSGLSLIYR